MRTLMVFGFTTAAAVAISLLYESDINFNNFIHFPSLLITIIFPIIYMLVLYGQGVIKIVISPICPKCNGQEVIDSVVFYKTLGKAVWLFSAVAALIGIILMSYVFYNDIASVGYYMTTALACPLYAAFFNLAVIIPLIAAAEKKVCSVK